MKSKIVLSFFCMLYCLPVGATVKPNRIFSSNMVLQRDRKVPIWGQANDGEKVTVIFSNQKISTVCHGSKWILWLKPMVANSSSQTMEIIGSNKIVLSNILIGEVWFCSGQSNMEMPVGPSGVYRGVVDYEQELKDINYPQIRFLQVPHSSSGLPVTELNLLWRKCDSSTVYWSSAVSWFFAKKINRELKVPIGVINSAWGGSAIQPWTPVSGLRMVGDFDKELTQIDSLNNKYESSNHISTSKWQINLYNLMDTAKVNPPSIKWLEKPKLPPSGHLLLYPKPSSIYNAMVAPLIPFAIRGVIWYQGESNLGDDLYAKRMEALIKGWRCEWGQGKFPFYFVQIAPFNYTDWPVKNATPDLLPKLLKQQQLALKIPLTGMVKTEDLGELDNIHPRHKKEVGERLADIALRNTYKAKNR